MGSGKSLDKRSGSGRVHAIDSKGDIVQVSLSRRCVFTVSALTALDAEGYVWQVLLDIDDQRYAVGKYKSLGVATQACLQLNSDAQSAAGGAFEKTSR